MNGIAIPPRNEYTLPPQLPSRCASFSYFVLRRSPSFFVPRTPCLFCPPSDRQARFSPLGSGCSKICATHSELLPLPVLSSCRIMYCALLSPNDPLTHSSLRLLPGGVPASMLWLVRPLAREKVEEGWISVPVYASSYHTPRSPSSERLISFPTCSTTRVNRTDAHHEQFESSGITKNGRGGPPISWLSIS